MAVRLYLYCYMGTTRRYDDTGAIDTVAVSTVHVQMCTSSQWSDTLVVTLLHT